ncbi:MAG: hypothetical protein Q7R47_02240 [Candidatus Diapherotrites archaeon]|nr:hypothetical protein [Candidatus Diapherotrites archaeon]
MQAIEMVVFFFSAVVIGGMMIAFFANIDPNELYTAIAKIVFPERAVDSTALNRETLISFVGKIQQCWEKCEFGNADANCGTYYITQPDGDLNQTYLDEVFAKYNYCADCNIDLETPIPLPAVVNMSCTASKIQIRS